MALSQDVFHLMKNILQILVYAAESLQRKWFTGAEHTKIYNKKKRTGRSRGNALISYNNCTFTNSEKRGRAMEIFPYSLVSMTPFRFKRSR